MRYALLAILLLPASASAEEGLIDTSSVDKQVNDLTDRARESVHDALAPDDGKAASGSKGTGKGRTQKSTGLIDMTSINQQASDLTEHAHQSVQSSLAGDSKSKSSTSGKRRSNRPAKSKPTTAKSPSGGSGVTAPSS